MILRTPNGSPIEVFFLTNSMVKLLAKVGIPLSNLSTIETYHQKATYGEIAQIISMQYQAAKELGVALLDPDLIFSKDYEGEMLKAAFNSVDSKSLSAAFNSATSFGYSSFKSNQLVVVINDENQTTPPSWSKASALTFSGALLEAILHVHGYMESHFGAIVDSKVGEFTMAEVYKLLGNQNP